MCPLQLDMNEEKYSVEIIPSGIVDMIAAIHVLADRNESGFEKEFSYRLYERLSDRSKAFLDFISGLNFPGVEFLGLFFSERIFHDLDAFLERIASYRGVDFISLALDMELTREQITAVVNKEMDISIVQNECCNLWKGRIEPIEALFYDTENYKMNLIELAREIYHSDIFKKKLGELECIYKRSAEEIRGKLADKSPLEIVSEIKKKGVKLEPTFKYYYFLPSYFLNGFNITAWQKEALMLFYSVNAGRIADDEQIEGILSAFKSLSDKTRLQILQLLKAKPAYGKQLAETLNLSTATISRHLDQLRSMNLIVEEKHENYKYFKLNKPEIERFLKNIGNFLIED